VTRLIGLLTGLLAVSAVSAQVHVPSSAASPGFLASRGSPAIWLPELDAGVADSSAAVFVPGNVADGAGVPLAFALDGGPIPLTINFVPLPAAPHQESSGWVRNTNMAVAHGLSVGGMRRNVVSTGAYRFFVYDGLGQLDDVTYVQQRLGPTEATSFEPGPVIYAAYVKNLNAYHPIILDGGLSYDTNFTGGSEQGLQAQFSGYVETVAGIPRNDLLVGTGASDTLDHAALFKANRLLKTVVSVEDGGQLGQTMEGLAVYHADNVVDGGAGDWALVSSDGRLLLYQVLPSFGFITELVIDGPNPSPYYQGITLSNLALGPYDKGVVVVFDSSDTTTGSGQLLFVRWDDIVNAVDAGLAIDTTFDVRTYNASGGPGGGSGGGGPGPATPPLGPGVGGSTSLTGGGCGSGAAPMLPLAGALVVIGGFARGRRRR
jgi:hypothetical protein